MDLNLRCNTLYNYKLAVTSTEGKVTGLTIDIIVFVVIDIRLDCVEGLTF